MENLHKGHRERLRQSYIENGPDGMHEHQLLELLLTYAIPRRDTNPIAHRLLDKSAFGSLWEVLNAGPKELMAVEGIGESAAVLLSLVGAMGRRAKAKGMAAQKKGSTRRMPPCATAKACRSTIPTKACTWYASIKTTGYCILSFSAQALRAK